MKNLNLIKLADILIWLIKLIAMAGILSIATVFIMLLWNWADPSSHLTFGRALLLVAVFGLLNIKWTELFKRIL